MAKYQISTDMKFDKQTDRDEVFVYLHGKKALAMIDKGDFLLLENEIDGTFKVACTYRIEKKVDRDEVETYLKSKKVNARMDKQGKIESHECLHDVGKGCVNQVLEEWGGE